MEEVSEGYLESMDLFTMPPKDISIKKEEWVDFAPLGSISEGAPVEFSIDGNSLRYVDLSKTRLNFKFKIITEEGKDLPVTSKVCPINLALQTFWRQIDLTLAQVPMFGVGMNYPWKAMIDVLLTRGHEAKTSQLQAQFYWKDTAGAMDEAEFGGNEGFNFREKLCDGSNEIELEGALFLDMAQQDRPIINNVAIGVKLWPAPLKFRLLSADEEPKYKLVMSEATLKVCQLTINPNVVLSHQDALKVGPALYPFTRSDIKTYTVAKGSHNFRVDNLFNGEIPSRLVVGLVDASAYSGSYTKNPFNFAHFNVNAVGFYVENNPTPHKPFAPDFEGGRDGTFTAPFLSMFGDQTDQDWGNNIGRIDFPQGYALYRFEVDKEEVSVKKGTTRLELGFKEATPEVITVIAYAHFPAVLRIDESRKVLL